MKDLKNTGSIFKLLRIECLEQESVIRSKSYTRVQACHTKCGLPSLTDTDTWIQMFCVAF